MVAVVVSELAARSRRRAREASLLAEIAGSLLEHGAVSADLDRISADAARALQVESARIELGPTTAGGYELVAGGRRVGSIHLEGAGSRGAARAAAAAAGARVAARPSRSTASSWSARRSRPRRCGAPTR